MEPTSCGNCKWHHWNHEIGDWECVNPYANEYMDLTDYSYTCEDWEARHE